MFCAAVGLLYLSLSPGSIAGMGYMAEEMNATDALLSIAASPLTGKPALRVEWPRNGLVDLAFHVPFIVAANLFFPGSFQWKDRFLSVEPATLTSLLLTIVFVWTAALTRRWSRGLLLSLVLAFCTLIWPYAYIGLEVLDPSPLSRRRTSPCNRGSRASGDTRFRSRSPRPLLSLPSRPAPFSCGPFSF